MYSSYIHNPNMYKYLSIYLVLLIALVVSVGCKELYVSPSTANDSSCSASTSTDSCMSLSEIVAAVSDLAAESNLTIIFLPGNHTVTLNSTDFSLMVHHVTMKSQGRDGPSSYVIKCHNSSKFQFRFNTFVHISGLTFNGCFEIEIYNVNEFVMEDCRLFGMETPFGRGLVVTQSELSIRRTYFVSFHGSASHKGGAVYCSQSTVHLSDCVLTKNSAISGAVVHVEGNSTLIVSNCLFSNHTRCSSNNETDSVQYYGVVYTNASSVILSDSNFSNNSFYQGNLTTDIYNGGVLGALKSNISISRCTFMGNTAFNGGVAYCHEGAKLMISDSKFTQNEAKNNGGVFPSSRLQYSHQWE